MNHLTEEQKKRIEENRRKALEKRAAKNQKLLKVQNATQQINHTKSLTSCNIFSTGQAFPLEKKDSGCLKGNISNLPTVSSKNTQGSATNNNLKNACNTINPITNVFYNKSLSSATNNSTVVIQKSSVSSFPLASSFLGENSISSVASKYDISNVKSFYDTSGKPLSGKFVLLTRKRFFIDVPYHQLSIEIFKTIPSRMYDAKTKRWNFSLEDHDKLVYELKKLHPNVTFSPLPRFILNTFSKASEYREIKQYDLSSLHQELQNALLPFQKEGVYFGIQHNGKVLIADDMGLGKTIQAIAILNYFKEDWPVLIVSPSSVKYAWVESFRMWLPSLSHEVIVINSGKDYIPNNQIIIMSYDFLTRKKDEIIKRGFRSVVLDESHFLKNPKSARTKAAQYIIKSMKRIIMLSGTPALSRPIELFTQLSALRPTEFSSYINFGIRYCNGKKAQWGWDFSGSSYMEELQLLLEEIVMIRRLKSEVITQLPSKRRQMILLDPSRVDKSEALTEVSKKMGKRNLKGMERRGVLLEYFHVTGIVKLPAVCEYIKDLLEADRKFLCFAHHQIVMDGICHAINEAGIDYIRIDGSTAAERRKTLCDRFQVTDSCKVAVLSITAANAGITLTSGHLVVFAELFWNPGILTQAEDRAHRIGQEDCVVIQYLVAKSTADDYIWPLVQKKLDTLNKAGLSKDNFKTADTVSIEDSLQPTIEEFWNELEQNVDFEIQTISESRENNSSKRSKLDN